MLGFFQPGKNSSARRNRYLGIWYANIPQTVVWVANREQPITDSDGLLTISDDGNIALVDSFGSLIWSSGVRPYFNNTQAKLLDTGNLVLEQDNGQTIWESFDHPGDTYLPGMKLRNEWGSVTKRMTSWKNDEDPSPGDFFAAFSSLQLMVFKNSTIIWSSGPQLGSYLVVSANNSRSGQWPVVYLLTGSRGDVTLSVALSGANILVRCIMEHSGHSKGLIWENATNSWQSLFTIPSTFCHEYGVCGPWGACEDNKCRCLEGFEPTDKSNPSGGCVRKVPLKFSSEDKFLSVKNTNLAGNFTMVDPKSEEECQSGCLSRNQCTAYTYSNLTTELGKGYCLLWDGDIPNLMAPDTGTLNLSIRVDASKLSMFNCFNLQI